MLSSSTTRCSNQTFVRVGHFYKVVDKKFEGEKEEILKIDVKKEKLHFIRIKFISSPLQFDLEISLRSSFSCL